MISHNHWRVRMVVAGGLVPILAPGHLHQPWWRRLSHPYYYQDVPHFIYWEKRWKNGVSLLHVGRNGATFLKKKNIDHFFILVLFRELKKWYFRPHEIWQKREIPLFLSVQSLYVHLHLHCLNHAQSTYLCDNCNIRENTLTRRQSL